MQYEIYVVPVPQLYVGMPFSHLVRVAYHGSGVMIFGVRHMRQDSKFEFYETYLNPSNHILEE